MKICYECGKELKFWERYCHPVLGSNIVVCGKCFEILEESLEIYRSFILSEFKNERQNKIIDTTDLKLRFHNWWNHLKSTH